VSVFRLIDRYLIRELYLAFFAVCAVLGLVLVGGVLTDVLNRIASGRIPASLLLSQLGLRSLDAVALILPLAAFLAVLICYGRLYRDSEIAVLSASGLRLSGLVRPMWFLALPVFVLLALVSFWGSPMALDRADTLVREANRSLLVAGMEPGRFVDMPGKLGVIYVGKMSEDGTRFERLFVQHEREGRLDIVTAASGRLFYDQDGAQRFLSLSDGFRVEGSPDSPEFRTMRFQRNDIRLPEPEQQNRRRVESIRSTQTLLASDQAADRAELQWRLGVPLSAVLLMLLAFPLAKSPPREPRYGRILIAILGYLLYSNLLALGRGWVAIGAIPESIGLWWIHALVLILALVLMRMSERLPRGRG
jgi:lipopolysaccharide export system permease protein